MQKLLSRKFLVTIGALVALIQGSKLDAWHMLVIAGVASAYVIAETILDHAGLPSLTSQLGEVLEAQAGTVTNVRNINTPPPDDFEKGLDLLERDLDAAPFAERAGRVDVERTAELARKGGTT